MRMSLCAAAMVALLIGCGSKSPGTQCADEDGDGVTNCDGDCDDADPLAVPGGNEICGDDADNNCDGQQEESCPGGVGTFVSAIVGNDANPGTKTLPVATIGKGMANASMIGGDQTVIVGEGVYQEKVTLAEAIDLQGGYACDAAACEWTRDAVVHESLIENRDFDGVVAGMGITQKTLFEGFAVKGFDGVPMAAPGSIGVMLAGGSPTVRGNRITGGNVTGGGFAANRSIAVIIRSTTDPAGALVEGNELVGGRAIELSAGLAIEGFPAQTTALATIRGNIVRGGQARRSIGLVAFSAIAGTVVSNNDIYAGNSDAGLSAGIQVGSEMTIDGNRINVDRAQTGTCLNTRDWCAGIRSDSSKATITNNIVFGATGQRTAAVFLGEFEIPAGAVVLNGNTLVGGGGGAASAGNQSESAAVVVSIGTCTSCGFNGFVGRVRNNILDGGTNQLRFGVREDPAMGRTMRVEQLENNLFWFPPAPGPARLDAMYRQVQGNGVKDLKTIAEVNMLQAPPAKGNIAGDPMLDGTWHLMPGSPCVDGGMGTEAPALDFEGDARPAGASIDIGHDEMP